MEIYRDGELFLYGYVGESYWDEGFTASEVLTALAEHGRDNDLTVHINSGGGRVDDGVAIYNALANHRGEIRIEIDAVALSAASLIAMAGDEIVMRAGALMMIHDPLTITLGNSAEHSKTIEQLEAFATQMASIYAERSSKTPEDARAVMRKETWMTADEAVAEGFADEAEAAKSKATAAFDFRVYAKAPRQLKTLARKNGWSIENPKTVTVTEASDRLVPEEPNMTPEEAAAASAAAVKADRDRRKAILALNEAKDRRGLAEHFADYTAMAIEDVQAALAAAPKATAITVDQTEYENARQTTADGAGLGGGADGRRPAPKAVTIDRTKIFAARRPA